MIFLCICFRRDKTNLTCSNLGHELQLQINCGEQTTCRLHGTSRSVTLCSSLPQGSVISRNRGGSNWFSASEFVEQDTRWQDAAHVYRWAYSDTLGTVITKQYRAHSYRETCSGLGQEEKWTKLLQTPSWLLQWKHSIDIKKVLMWIQKVFEKSLDGILKSDRCYELIGTILVKGF